MTESQPTKVAVLYLARKAEGLVPFRNFVKSYNEHAAGMEHDLIIIYKGFDDEKDAQEAYALFAPYSQVSIYVDDTGFDLGSYHRAAQKISNEYICCFNTFSQICADNWLQKLYAQISLPEVGIAGATASYESIQSSILLLEKVSWLGRCKYLPPSYYEKLTKYHSINCNVARRNKDLNKKKRFILERIYRFFRRIFLQFVNSCRKLYFYCLNYALKGKVQLKVYAQYEREHAKHVAESENLRSLLSLPPFPNPHMRSNGFIIKRNRWLSSFDDNLKDKIESYKVESGYDSITRQLLREGLKARLVDKNGSAFEMEDWPKSNIFRQGNHENLMVTDNITRLFDNLSPGSKITYSLITWGENYTNVPEDYPDIKIKFANTPWKP